MSTWLKIQSTRKSFWNFSTAWFPQKANRVFMSKLWNSFIFGKTFSKKKVGWRRLWGKRWKVISEKCKNRLFWHRKRTFSLAKTHKLNSLIFCGRFFLNRSSKKWTLNQSAVLCWKSKGKSKKLWKNWKESTEFRKACQGNIPTRTQFGGYLQVKTTMLWVLKWMMNISFRKSNKSKNSHGSWHLISKDSSLFSNRILPKSKR